MCTRIETGKWIRGFGYKWRHDIVYVDNRRVGVIQVKVIFRRGRMPERVESVTALDGGGCVLGTDLAWLERQVA